MSERNARPPDRGGPNGPTGIDQVDQDRLVRLSVNLRPESTDILKEYARRKGISITEAVRRAIGVLHFVDESQEKGQPILANHDGSLREIVFLV